jgi:hypothetical protein
VKNEISFEKIVKNNFTFSLPTKLFSMKNATINVKGLPITIIQKENEDYISLTDMLKAKDGDLFISDWLRNRNTVEFLGIWESIYNVNSNYGEFATI